MQYASDSRWTEFPVPQTEGLFLTERGLTRVGDMYREMSHSEGRVGDLAVDGAVSALFGDAWDSFDDVYLAFYAANLTGGHKLYARNPGERAEGMSVTSLDLLLSTDFPRVSRGTPFEATLLDEFAVARVINLRHALTRMVPYDLELSRMATGCLYLGFSIWSLRRESTTGQELGDLPGLRHDTLANSEWSRLRQRFGVTEVHIHPAGR